MLREQVQLEYKQVMASWDAYVDKLYSVDSSKLHIDADEDDTAATDDDDADNGAEGAFSFADYSQRVLGIALGCTLGRWHVQGGIQESPERLDPFTELPKAPPASLAQYSSVGLAQGTERWSELATDDEGSESDAGRRLRWVLQLMFQTAEAASELCSAACASPDLREWLRSAAFEQHIRRFSKSRRKSPIYWQLATPSASYSVWLYYHRLTKDTFYKVLNDYVTPKLQHEVRKLTNFRQEAGPNPTVNQRKEITEQEAFVEELRAFRDEVARIAPLWNPDLNDGVIINFALLWRLVPQHRQWQQECKDCWDKLVKGDYDWAHLAMHLWPERVIPKCAEDRSLAIAHGLEEVFWYEDDDGKWYKRNVPRKEVDTLIAEQTSPSVKAALKDLLSAPAPTAGRSRSKARRSRTVVSKTAATDLFS